MGTNGQLEMFGSEDTVDDVIPWGPSPTGKELKEDGMARAKDHCEEEEPGWTARAIECVADYCREHQDGKPFTSTMIREWAEAFGFPVPASKRGWGPVMNTAAKRGIIKKHGIEASPIPAQHMGWVTTWIPARNGV